MVKRRCFGLLVVLMLLLLAGCQESSGVLARGQLIPAFTLPDLQGVVHRLPVSRRGDWLLIHFWADWCPPCLQELRETEPVYRRLSGEGFSVLAINIEQPRQQVLQVVGELGISFPVLLDASGEVARRYGVNALPVSYLVDPDGRLQARLLGGITGPRLEEILRGLL